MKANEAHTVYLSPRAAEILRRQRGQDKRLLFSSPMTLDRDDGDRKPLSNMTLLGRMGYRDRTTVHGLCRATFRTWANETGAARPDVIEACLAHEESNRVRAAYNRAKFNEERRALLEAWATFLDRPPADVLPLGARVAQRRTSLALTQGCPSSKVSTSSFLQRCPSMSINLQIAKWGNSLAMRLPAELVRRFGLRDGDSVEAQITADGALAIRPTNWSRRAFAAELAEARDALPMGEPVIEQLRGEARY